MKQRIASVDILRGLTITAMMLVNNPGDWGNVYAPLLHAPWHGYTPTDLVFPFFLFIVGCSVAFAYRGKAPGPAVYRKITVRSLKLIGLGLFLGAFTLSFPFVKEWEAIRFPGVLQRIGVVFFFTALLALHLSSRALVGVVVAFLAVYTAWLGYLPLPDGTAPTFDRAPNNWAMYVDKLILGSHTWQPDYDPEGILSTIPSVATALIGVLAGRYLLNPSPSRTLIRGADKAANLAFMGISLLLFATSFTVSPVNKALWTSSFVIATAAWALLALALIHYLTDERGLRIGSVFKMVGANALLLYFLSSFISKVFGLTGVHAWLYETIYVQGFLPAKLSSLLYGLSVAGFYVGLGVWLYRRGIFVKV